MVNELVFGVERFALVFLRAWIGANEIGERGTKLFAQASYRIIAN